MATKHGGNRHGAGRPKGSKNKNYMPDAKSSTVWGKVAEHTAQNLEFAALEQHTTQSALVGKLVDRKYRCRCEACQAARRAAKRRQRAEGAL